jgi:adenylate cyclase class 2
MATGKENLEVEVKFLVEELDAARQRLLAAGATLLKPRILEHNIRFDTPGESLRQRDELLRLRQDTAARLTFKGASHSALSSEAKVREEIEVEVSSLAQIALILERLGFRPFQVYEKYRETFHWRGVEIVLDEMPFGNFIELEGDEAAIKQAAAALGFDWSQRILDNYLAIMERLKQHFHLPFSDITFRHFEDYPVAVRKVLSLDR